MINIYESQRKSHVEVSIQCSWQTPSSTKENIEILLNGPYAILNYKYLVKGLCFASVLTSWQFWFIVTNLNLTFHVLIRFLKKSLHRPKTHELEQSEVKIEMWHSVVKGKKRTINY